MKKNNYLEYKGYKGKIETSIVDEVLHGKVLFINDLITYEANSIAELKKEFIDAVDDYLDTCIQLGREPNKPFSGSFQVRVSPEIHKELAIQALQEGISQSKFVADAINEKLSDKVLQVNHTHNVEHTVTVKRDIEIPNQDQTQWEVPNIQLSNIAQIHH